MDELQISGKRFISSRRIARENGYTSDYIGQLIRGGKIIGTKVGRAWYVEAASFDAYLGQESDHVTADTSEVPETPAQGAIEETTPKASPIEEIAPIPVQTTEAIEAMLESKKDLLPTVDEVEAIKEIPAKEEEVSAEPVAIRIPLHVTEITEEAQPATSGLRYMVDDEPSLPEISRNKKGSRMGEREVSDVRAVSSTAKAFAPVAKNKRVSSHVALLAALAVAIFAITALVSSTLSLNLSIEAGNTATAAYSFK